jgi:DNA-binding transcriptional ArsR family regulator
MSKTKTDVESAVEDTVLTDVLGPHAKVKILTALLSENDRDLNATEIARLAGIDRSTFYEHLDDLLDYEMIVETRRVGNSQMYAINRENPAAEALAQMEWDLLEYVDESG